MQYSERRHKDHTPLDILRFRLGHDQKEQLLFDIRAPGISVTHGDGTPISEPLVGTLAAYIDAPNRRADMGILIFPEYAGEGCGLEAWKQAMSIVFDHVNRVFAGMMAHNRGMRRICEKSGMCECGRIPGYFQFNGEPEDAVFYRRDK